MSQENSFDLKFYDFNYLYDIDDFANIKRFIANIGGDVNILPSILLL